MQSCRNHMQGPLAQTIPSFLLTSFNVGPRLSAKGLFPLCLLPLAFRSLSSTRGEEGHHGCGNGGVECASGTAGALTGGLGNMGGPFSGSSTPQGVKQPKRGAALVAQTGETLPLRAFAMFQPRHAHRRRRPCMSGDPFVAFECPRLLLSSR